MTTKARAVLQRMIRRRLFGNPRARDRVLGQFNKENLDDVGPLGGDRGEKFLMELNEMADLESNAGRKDNPDR